MDFFEVFLYNVFMRFKKSSETKWTSRKGRKFFGVWIEVDSADSFNQLYHGLFSVFVRRCVLRAINDKSFFDDIFYNTFDEYDELGSNNPNFNSSTVQRVK